MPKKKANFETDIARLAEIVEQVEDSQTPLDTAISLYKEGLELASQCGKILSQYEEEILILQKEADGNFICQEIAPQFLGGMSETQRQSRCAPANSFEV